MPLSVGDKLGPYEILAPIGAGGMGEVYRARDPRLNREVAIKVSAERFSDRFEREAHAIAALNHTNICTLFDSRNRWAPPIRLPAPVCRSELQPIRTISPYKNWGCPDRNRNPSPRMQNTPNTGRTNPA
jgi:hypothetical protein